MVATLGAPHGVRGELRLRPETDYPERLRVGRAVLVCAASDDDGTRALASEIAGIRNGSGGHLLVRLRGIGTRDAASGYAGGTLRVAVKDLPPLAPGQYYHHELVGLRVVDGRQAVIGVVEEVLRMPAHDVFVVRGEGGERLVPATRQSVAAIDLAAGEMRLSDLASD